MRTRVKSAPAPSGDVTITRRHQVKHVLRMHAATSAVPVGKLDLRREVRVATVFRDVPADFLKVIVLQERARMK